MIWANTIDTTIGEDCKRGINSVKISFEKLSIKMNLNFIELIVKKKIKEKEILSAPLISG